jgi:hypothetical protein
MFQTKFVEKIKTHFIFYIFSENCFVYEIMWKNIVEPDRPRWQYNRTHADCRLDKEGYRRTFWICNSYCFSTAPTVTHCASKLRLSVRCLWCFYACLIIYACLLFELRPIRVKIYVRICVLRWKRNFYDKIKCYRKTLQQTGMKCNCGFAVVGEPEYSTSLTTKSTSRPNLD